MNLIYFDQKLEWIMLMTFILKIVNLFHLQIIFILPNL